MKCHISTWKKEKRKECDFWCPIIERFLFTKLFTVIVFFWPIAGKDWVHCQLSIYQYYNSVTFSEWLMLVCFCNIFSMSGHNLSFGALFAPSAGTARCVWTKPNMKWYGNIYTLGLSNYKNLVKSFTNILFARGGGQKKLNVIFQH